MSQFLLFTSVLLAVMSGFNLFNMLEIKRLTDNQYPEFPRILSYVMSGIGLMIAFMGMYWGWISTMRRPGYGYSSMPSTYSSYGYQPSYY